LQGIVIIRFIFVTRSIVIAADVVLFQICKRFRREKNLFSDSLKNINVFKCMTIIVFVRKIDASESGQGGWEVRITKSTPGPLERATPASVGQ
jgi:hypothetical protein